MFGVKFGLAILITTLAVWSSAWADQGDQYHGMHMWEGGWHGWVLGPFMMITFLVIAVIVVVLIVRWLVGSVMVRFIRRMHRPVNLRPTSSGNVSPAAKLIRRSSRSAEVYSKRNLSGVSNGMRSNDAFGLRVRFDNSG